MKPLEQVQQEALSFVRDEAGFAQVFTVNEDGFPVGRTMGARVRPDWTVPLIQRRVHHRLDQMRHNPAVEVVWVGIPAPTSVNDQPHVFDYDLRIPRAVFLRGVAEFMDTAWTVETYAAITAEMRARGNDRAPNRDPEGVARELVGIQIRPVRVRAEGFGEGAQAFTWQI